MTDDELRDYLESMQRARTDLHHVEAKRARGELPKRLWETLSAFANSPGGGIIILGVDEQAGFTTSGVANPRKLFQDLANITVEMEPRLAPVIEIKEIDGQQVIVAEVSELLPHQKPCYYHPAGLTNGAFIRVGGGDRKLTAYEMQLMLASRGQPIDDRSPVPEAGEEDLDSTLVAAFLEHARKRRPRLRAAADAQILRTLKVLYSTSNAAPEWQGRTFTPCVPRNA